MSLDLERQIWRYSHGLCSANRLERALRAELHRLVTARSELESRREELRSNSGGALLLLDDRIQVAHTRLQLGSSEYRQALLALREAASALQALIVADEAHRQLTDVSREWEELVERRGLTRFEQLATLRIPRRLLTLARETLEAGEPRKALVITRWLRRMVTRLGERRQDSLRSGSLLSWLEITRTEEIYPEAMTVIRRLLADGCLALAESLGNDLEIQVAAAARAEEDDLRQLEATQRRAVSVEKVIADWLAGAV